MPNFSALVHLILVFLQKQITESKSPTRQWEIQDCHGGGANMKYKPPQGVAIFFYD